MKKQSGYDYLAKLLIIGDSGVGKTNILLRFCENNFMTSHLTTIGTFISLQKQIGIDFKIKTIQIDGKKIRMQIWDTAGQQRFKTITQTYYKGAMGIIMTYAVNDLQSFNAMENWLRQIKTHASQNVVKILIANKIDCTDRQVTYQQGKQLAQNFGVQFFQVSAKDNKNISEVFMFMGKQIKDKILTGQINNTPKNVRGKQLKQTKKQEQSSCC